MNKSTKKYINNLKPLEIEVDRIHLDCDAYDVTLSIHNLMESSEKIKVNIEYGYKGDADDIYLVGYRTETPQEFIKRKNELIQQMNNQDKAKKEEAKNAKKLKDEQDRREFERLKKKYG